MATQATDKLVVIDGMPSVEKLWNGRFRLEFFCKPSNKNEGWYGDNIDKWLPEFGTLQGADFTGEGWEALDGEVYPNMCLVGAEVPYIPPSESHMVKLTYETLTASWAEEKDEDTDYELNGLKRVTRTFVALPDTTYDKVVGTDTIDSDGTILTLGSFSVKETDSKWELAEVWLESGELSRSENFEDGKESVSITQIGGCPSAPSGYTVVNENKDNTQGFETCARTFYKDDSVLSRSNDYVGSQRAEVIEVFNPSGQPTPTNGSAVLGSKSQSNVDGIPTTRYTFLVPSILSESEDKVGSQKAITIEAFSETPSTPSGYTLANKQESDYEGIKTRRYTFLKPSILSQSEDKVGSQLAITVEAFNETPSTPGGYVVANTQDSDVEGIPTRRYTFLKRNIKLSESEDKVGSQKAITEEWFDPTSDPIIPEYVVANTQDSDVEGIPTKRFTFLKDNVQLSESNDYIGSQLAITEEWFNPDADLPIPDGYIEANTQDSDVEGIPTKRFTFLKEDVQLSDDSDKVGSQLAIVEEWFNPADGRETKAEYVLAKQGESNVEGIPTKRFTFLKDNVQLSESNDYIGSQLAITQEWFNPTEDPIIEKYVIANKQESDYEGIPTKRYTFLKEDTILSRTNTNRHNDILKVETIAVFNPSKDPIPTIGEEAVLTDTVSSDVEGIPTTTYTFVRGLGIISKVTTSGPVEFGATTSVTTTEVKIPGEAPTPPEGIIIEERDIENDGYVTYIRTAIEGAIEGVKTSSIEEAVVEVPGVVRCVTADVTEGDVSGDIAIVRVTPVRQEKVSVSVKREILTQPPELPGVFAYNLGKISCSVTFIQTKLQSGDGSFATVSDGGTTTSQVGFQKSFASNVSIQNYPGCYLDGDSSSGSVSYQSSSQPYQSGSNAISVQTAFSSSSTKCEGDGSTDASTWVESGIISRSVRPVLVAVDGTQYYEVITKEAV